MSTAVETKDGEVVATRWCSRDGMRVQMEMTEREWAAWRGVMVAEEATERWECFADWVARQRAVVVWDSAARQNERARDFESSRFADMMMEAASAARARARRCVRDEMRVV